MLKLREKIDLCDMPKGRGFMARRGALWVSRHLFSFKMT
jgi:hypothetical protein